MKRLISFLGRYGVFFLYFAALCVAVVAVCGAGDNTLIENTRFTDRKPAVFDHGWTLVTPTGDVPLGTFSRTAAGTEGEKMTVRRKLPPLLVNDASLCIQTKNESVRVWIGDNLIYTYGEMPQKTYGHGVGAIWNVASLPDNAAGKTITVELRPIGGRTGLAPYRVYLGSRSDLVNYLLWKNRGIIFICVLLLLIGLVSLVLSIVYFFQNDTRGHAVFHFSVFVLLATVWTVTDGGLMQFLIRNKGVSYLMFGCSFYLFYPPFVFFMADILPDHRKLFHGLAAVGAIYGAVRVILYCTGVADFEYALWVLHLLMAIDILAINCVFWIPVIRRRSMPRPDLCVAVTAFTVVDGISLLSFYVGDKMDQLRNGYASGFYLGILLFVILTAGSALRRNRALRRQAFKAEFFERRAYTDDLTGLLSAKGLDDKGAELITAMKSGRHAAIVDLDINYFSQYNANNGWAAGDELLLKLAGGIRAFCRSDELCARLEADHFACLLQGKSMDEILERVRAVDRNMRDRQGSVTLLLSYGVVEVTDPDLSVTALRNQAATAKRTVKGNYEKNIAIYDRAMHDRQLREVALVAGFEAALRTGSYVIYLQPKINTRSETIAGAEALVRKIEPNGTVTSAGDIIGALERRGYVDKLDFNILEQVCRFQRRCLREGRLARPISCNFSRMHLFDLTFTDRICKTVDQFSVPHELIEIELTETAFQSSKETLQRVVSRLHADGFRVSIDDFGSGYSSLNMLKDVDVDVIKLDREFLAGVEENRRARTIIEQTLRLTREMQITSVAEGIETEAQLRYLRQVGCDLIQGYYYSMPIPQGEFIAKYLPVKKGI